MDKYQFNLINRNINISLLAAEGSGKAEIRDSEIVLTQNENYNVTKYVLVFENDAIESIKLDDSSYLGSDKIKVAIDFSNKSNKLTIYFKNGFAEPCGLKVTYVDADRSRFDSKMAAENKELCLKRMNPTCRVGMDLVNLYWNKAADNYARTTLTFFAEVPGGDIFLEKFEIQDGCFYKVVTGLAFGKYKFGTNQFDTNGREIITTIIPFEISNSFEKSFTKVDEKLNQVGAQVSAQIRASGKHQVRS
jgi:hypothetical protein